MALRVFHADANPRVDRYSYKQSPSRAAEIVASGQGKYITLADGRTAVQLFRPHAAREQWIERFEEIAQVSASPGMPFLKIRWPESVKKLRAESLIPNVRAIAASA